MTGRFLALHLPGLATDRIRRAEPDLPLTLPLATWAPSGNRRLLAAVDHAAAAMGLRPGQALADAQAIAPELVLRLADPEGDVRALQALADRFYGVRSISPKAWRGGYVVAFSRHPMDAACSATRRTRMHMWKSSPM